jgi:biotin carboxyl carrier protein
MIFEAVAAGQTLRLEIHAGDGFYTVETSGRKLRVEMGPLAPFLALTIDGQTHELGISGRGSLFDVTLPEGTIAVELKDVTRLPREGPVRAAAGPARVTAPMPGKVTRVLVTHGQTVAAGAGLVVVEAMKMENELRAPRAGAVLELPAREGMAVESGALLVVVG